MKIIRYKFSGNGGVIHTAEMDYSLANEVLAKQEAINGKYTIEEVPDNEILHTASSDTDAMLVEHEYRLTLLELGLTEMEV